MINFNYADYAWEQAAQLLAIDSPSGFTGKAVAWLKDRFEGLGFSATVTTKGGLLVDLGGSNDADLFDDEIREGKPCRLGHLDPLDFGGEYDVRTFTGALEDVFYRAIALWPNARIGYIVAQKMGLSRHSQYNRRRYFDRAVAVCRKWGIPYIDLWESCPLNPCHPAHYFPETKGEENRDKNIGYYIDGGHLTARGYDLTADLVLKWIKTI
jgi:hypothetical protein